MQDSVIERCARAIGDHYDGYADPVAAPNNWASAMGAARAVLNVPGIFIAPDRKPEDSDLGYRGRVYMAFRDWMKSAINEGDA